MYFMYMYYYFSLIFLLHDTAQFVLGQWGAAVHVQLMRV